MDKVRSITSWHPLTRFAVSGLLLGVGHAVPFLWWLSLLGVALFIQLAFTVRSGKVLFWGGVLAFTLRYLFALMFFWSVYPIEILPVDLSTYQLPLIIFYWLSGSWWLGLAGGMLALAYGKVFQSFARSWWLLGLVPITWLAAELLAPLIFSTVATIGNTMHPDPWFSFGSMGYLLAEHGLLFWTARLGGLYALSLVALLLGTFIYTELASGHSRRAVALLFGIVCTGFITMPTTFTPTLGISVATIQTDFSGRVAARTEEAPERQALLTEAVTTALTFAPDTLVLPEDARLFDSDMSAEQAYFFSEFQFDFGDTVVIDSARTKFTPEHATVRATIIDPLSEQAFETDKQFLVPQGEYMPPLYIALFNLLGFERGMAKITEVLDFRPGPLATQANFPAHVPGVLFCAESTMPLGVWRLQQQRDFDYMVHPVAHSWFNNPQQLWHQLDVMLRIQAVWNQVPIVTAGNKVVGTLYTPQGTIIDMPVVAAGDRYEVRLIDL